jgi:hypothetical protein
VLLAGRLRAADDPDPAKTAAAVLERVNKQRADAKAAALTESEPLAKAAREFAEHLARTGKFDHNSDGKEPHERAVAHGYDTVHVGENISRATNGAGQKAEQVADRFVASWLKSGGHRENMLNPGYYETGVAVAVAADGTAYAVQVFGVPKSKEIRFTVRNDTGAEVTYKIDGKESKLPARGTATHVHGFPPELVVPQPEGVEKAEPIKYTPKAGERFTIRKGDGGALTVEKAEAPSPKSDAKSKSE